MNRNVLIVVHQGTSTPGRVGEFLTARGYSLDRRCPNMGDPLPTALSEYATCIVFGGRQSARYGSWAIVCQGNRFFQTISFPSP